MKALFNKLLIIALMILVSVPTPIFSKAVGSILAIIGDMYGNSNSTPTAYAILGGGLTQNQHNNKPLITLNTYSLLRTKTLWQHLKRQPLPVITSGVESPWIIDSLQFFAKKDNINLNLYKNSISSTPAKLLDNTLDLPLISETASMNTCENAWFSVRLINHAKLNSFDDNLHIFVVSDWYHMARARRQFAKAGVHTTALVAPMPTPTSWIDYKSNLNHSRRAFYESVALVRDIVRPQKDCRDANTLSINELTTPRRTLKTF